MVKKKEREMIRYGDGIISLRWLHVLIFVPLDGVVFLLYKQLMFIQRFTTVHATPCYRVEKCIKEYGGRGDSA